MYGGFRGHSARPPLRGGHCGGGDDGGGSAPSLDVARLDLVAGDLDHAEQKETLLGRTHIAGIADVHHRTELVVHDIVANAGSGDARHRRCADGVGNLVVVEGRERRPFVARFVNHRTGGIAREGNHRFVAEAEHDRVLGLPRLPGPHDLVAGDDMVDRFRLDDGLDEAACVELLRRCRRNANTEHGHCRCCDQLFHQISPSW